VHEGEGYDCRIYARSASHKELLAYLERRLLENGANSSFVNAVNDADVPNRDAARPPQQSFSGGRSARHAGIALPARIFGDRKNSAGIEFGSRAELVALERGIAAVALPLADAAPLIAGVLREATSVSSAPPA
jgi:RHH-type proline utilization regulon transcriptional repressor/proline dehydrogenase/delta 1-pyrroline-5-carboxylate dehydrogenase